MKTPLYYYNYAILLLISAILSLKTFRSGWPLQFRYFSIYLWFTVLIEFFAILWKDILYLHNTDFWHFTKYNGWIYNLYFIPLYIFYGYFFSFILRPLKIQRILRLTIIIFVVFAAINLFIIQGIYQINTFTIVGGCMVVIFLSCCYWYYLVTKEELNELVRQPEFWIVAGTFLCHLGIFTYYISTYTMNAEQLKEWLNILRLVVWSNTIMYSFYSIAFLCTRNYYK